MTILLAAILAACYPAQILGAYDGDTMTARIEVSVSVPELELETMTTIVRRVRIADLRAPELREPLGVESRAELVRILHSGAVAVCPRTKRDGRAVESFGRLVADVTVDGADVRERMIESGLGRPGGKEGW